LDFPPETARQLSESFVENLALLHSLDYAAAGLAELGKPQGYLERQVRGWTERYHGSKTHDYPEVEKMSDWMWQNIPPTGGVSLIHNDYKYDNVVLDPRDITKIIGVLDWEMCTIGDPLCDVGLLCVYWADDASDAAARTLHGRAITVEDGFYKRADLLRDYAAGTQRDLTSLDWYIALGAYKLAIIAEGITARFLMGMTVGEGFETMGEMVPAIVDSGLVALDRLRSTEGG
jgi:aminoglycoside phosphotransferase (APT) family kinase protein